MAIMPCLVIAKTRTSVNEHAVCQTQGDVKQVLTEEQTNLWRTRVRLLYTGGSYAPAPGGGTSMRTVENSIFDKWIAGGEPQRIAQAMGLELTEFGGGRAVIEFGVGSPHHNPTGTLHGGVLCYVADTAMGFAWSSGLKSGETFTTIEMKINFFRPVWTGTLAAEATVIRRGQTVGYAECDVKDEQGRLVAKSSSTLMTLRGEKAANRSFTGSTRETGQ
jgi:uncharacterized protein (TIGR00369 family)